MCRNPLRIGLGVREDRSGGVAKTPHLLGLYASSHKVCGLTIALVLIIGALP
jgi:hypothetical protein